MRGVPYEECEPQQLHHRILHSRRVPPEQAHRHHINNLHTELRVHRQLQEVFRTGSHASAEDALTERQTRCLIDLFEFFLSLKRLF